MQTTAPPKTFWAAHMKMESYINISFLNMQGQAAPSMFLHAACLRQHFGAGSPLPEQNPKDTFLVATAKT